MRNYTTRLSINLNTPQNLTKNSSLDENSFEEYIESGIDVILSSDIIHDWTFEGLSDINSNNPSENKILNPIFDKIPTKDIVIAKWYGNETLDVHGYTEWKVGSQTFVDKNSDEIETDYIPNWLVRR